MGLELQMDAVTAERDAGTLPADRINDVLYADLVADPVGVVAGLYQGRGLPISPVFEAALDAYVAARHQGRGAGGHDYSFADTGLDLATHRALVAGYQDRFGVPSEA
jgi:hypothetical protein